jgi:response regulator NasT
VKPFQKTDLVPAIELAIGRFAELKMLAGERDELDEQLKLRKTLDRAKGMLIDKYAMSEQSAFDFIQKYAMSSRSKMKDVADRVIAGEITPDS